jgi:hypothetical protein
MYVYIILKLTDSITNPDQKPLQQKQVGGDVELGLPDGTNSLALNKWSFGTAYGTATSFASAVAASGKLMKTKTSLLHHSICPHFNHHHTQTHRMCPHTNQSQSHHKLTGKAGLDYSLYGVWKTSPPLALAGKLTFPAGSDYSLTVGGVYRASPQTTLKGKVNLAGIAAASIIHVRLRCVTACVTDRLPASSVVCVCPSIEALT